MKTTQDLNTRNLIIGAILLVIISLYFGFIIGINQDSEISSSTQYNQPNTSNNATILTKTVASTADGGATLAGQVKNKLETSAKITLVGSFKNTWGDEITAANTIVEVPGSATADYSIEFGPEVAGFASFDVKVTEVN